MKLEFSGRNTKFHENSSIGSQVVHCGRTDRQIDTMKLLVAFSTSAHAPKNE